jgi:hypothetical protein
LKPITKNNKEKYIEIDGTKNDLKYNNRPMNLEDVSASELDEPEISEHMNISLKINEKLELEKETR